MFCSTSNEMQHQQEKFSKLMSRTDTGLRMNREHSQADHDPDNMAHMLQALPQAPVLTEDDKAHLGQMQGFLKGKDISSSQTGDSGGA